MDLLYWLILFTALGDSKIDESNFLYFGHF